MKNFQTLFNRLAVAGALGSSLFLMSCGAMRKAPVVYGAGSKFDAETKRVLLVSFDGLRSDAIAAAGAVHLQSMAAVGAQADAQAVLPSVTLVNHASMLAGVSPTKHGIDWNSYDPARGNLALPTIFDVAKSRGLRTAMVAGKEKFKHLANSVDRLVIEEGSQMSLAQEAIKVLDEVQPDVMFVHFRHPDTAGHDEGWMSRDQLDAIADADQGLGHILNALKAKGWLESTTVIATADHGGTGGGHGHGSASEMSIPWIAVGAEVPVTGHLVGSVVQYDTASTVAALLGLAQPANWDGKSVFNRPE
jgi:predicted AlkP superfamily pyrophosphatase or phosphodiesterase